jgi:hypothetical protein
MPFAFVKNVVQIAFLPQLPLIYDCIYFSFPPVANISGKSILGALKTRRVRKKGSVLWINKEIKAKLFERDFLKRKAIKTTDEASDWNRSNHRSPLEIQLILSCAKHAWKTYENDILGRSHNQNTVHEIKLSGKFVTLTEDLKEVFNEFAQTIEHDSDSNFGDFIIKHEPAIVHFLLRL